MLGQRLVAEVEVLDERTHATGRTYHECALTSEDGQTLHVFEGQLKEVPEPRLEVGGRYRLTFQPFVNNRWVELKIVALERLDRS